MKNQPEINLINRRNPKTVSQMLSQLNKRKSNDKGLKEINRYGSPKLL